MLTVVSFFWMDQERQRSRDYQITPEDVRIWDRMVARNLTVPHRRICITHRPDLINFMETVPLDTAKHVPGTCLVKLMAHRPDIAETLGERILTMDVDCVVVGNLDPIVQRDEPSVWWKNPNFEVGGKRGFVQGSMQLFTAGTTSFLWEDFNPNTMKPSSRFGGAEQAWISERLNDAWPVAGWEWSIPHWTEADGVHGAGRLFNGKMGKGVQSVLPEGARIVFTPGDRSPSQPEMRADHPWIERFYH